jgi:hypothetical protein
VRLLCNYLQVMIRIYVTEVLVGEDNPVFDGIFEFCSISAGGTVGKAITIQMIDASSSRDN